MALLPLSGRGSRIVRDNEALRSWGLKRGMAAFPQGQASFQKLGVRLGLSCPHVFIGSFIHSLIHSTNMERQLLGPELGTEVNKAAPFHVLGLMLPETPQVSPQCGTFCSLARGNLVAVVNMCLSHASSVPSIGLRRTRSPPPPKSFHVCGSAGDNQGSGQGES